MGIVDYANPYFSKVSGYKNDEIIGKDWFHFILPDSVTTEIFQSDKNPVG